MDNNIETICLESNKLKSFLQYNTDKEVESFGDSLIGCLHWICHYKEEDREVYFDLVSGVNIDEEKLDCNYFPIYSKKYKNDLSDMNDCVECALKKAIAICTGFSNVYIYIDTDNKCIKSGIYSTVLGKTHLTFSYLLTNNNIIIFQRVNNESIRVYKRNTEITIHFSFSLAKDPINTKPQNESHTFYLWNDIFDRVERAVHGTICLIVTPEWKGESDKNIDKDQIIILKRPIYLLPPISSSAENMIEFEKSFEIFLSMLNYDGITVLNTDGYVVAYNGFCKPESEGKINGGARHKAYSQLKNNPDTSYKAVYMLSQEGAVKFCTLGEPKQETDFFNPVIMKDSSKKKYYKEIQDHESLLTKNTIEDPELRKINILATSLRTIHNNFYNYYYEPQAAKDILVELNQHKDKISEQDYWNNNLLELKNLMNALLLCYIGNSYGFSFDAIDPIEKSLKLLKNCWESYSKHNMHLDPDILQELANGPSPYKRWSKLFASYGLKEYSSYQQEDYYEMLQAYRQYNSERLSNITSVNGDFL